MARPAKKASAKKTNSKTAAAKAPVKNSNGMVTLQKLYKFNLFAVVANVILAVLSVVFVSRETLSAVVTYSTRDELVGTLGTAYKTLLTVELRYVLAALFVVSAVLALLLATKLRRAYETGVKNTVSAWRWVFMGATLGLTLEIATVLAGVADIMTLKLVALLIVTTTVLAFLAERENKGTKKQYVVFGLSMLTGTIAWFPLVASLIATPLYGIEGFGWYVYALSALLLAGFSSICWTQYVRIRDGVSAKGYLQLEGKYLSTDFLLKLGTFVIIVLALHK